MLSIWNELIFHSVRICRSQESCRDALLSVTSLFIFGSKKPFYSTRNSFPYSPACDIILFIIMIIIFCQSHSRVLASGYFPVVPVSQRGLKQAQAPHSLGLSMTFLTVFRVKEGVGAGSPALNVCIYLGYLVLPFSAKCLSETRVWGYNKLHGYIHAQGKIFICDYFHSVFVIAGCFWDPLFFYSLLSHLQASSGF